MISNVYQGAEWKPDKLDFWSLRIKMRTPLKEKKKKTNTPKKGQPNNNNLQIMQSALSEPNAQELYHSYIRSVLAWLLTFQSS